MRYCATFLLSIFYLSLYSQAHYIDPEKLKWDDYIGVCPPNASATAGTQPKFILHPTDTTGGRLSGILVYVEFIPETSWVNWTILNQMIPEYQSNLLEHERLHYYTAIYLGKEMKIEISHKKYYTHAELQKMYDKYSQKFADMAKQYDDGSEHGENVKQQKVWHDRIMAQVNSVSNIQIDIPPY